MAADAEPDDEHYVEGGVRGDAEHMTLTEAEGPRAAGVPASGWVAMLFRADSDDVSRFWLVVWDALEVPRRAFEARSRY